SRLGLVPVDPIAEVDGHPGALALHLLGNGWQVLHVDALAIVVDIVAVVGHLEFRAADQAVRDQILVGAPANHGAVAGRLFARVSCCNFRSKMGESSELSLVSLVLLLSLLSASFSSMCRSPVGSRSAVGFRGLSILAGAAARPLPRLAAALVRWPLLNLLNLCAGATAKKVQLSRTSSPKVPKMPGQTKQLLQCLLLAAVAISRSSSIAVSGEGGGGNPLPPGSTGSNTVRLADNSHIRGFRRSVSGRDIWHYLGVPYARPPVDNLRFRAPVPLDAPIGLSYREPFDAFYKPKSCYFWPMSKSEFEINNPALLIWWNNTEMSEDCLYLNVWTPTENQGDKKAVMVWIFGGGFYGGSASLEIYDGAVLASKGDVVVASMQYRTGAFGFLYLDPDEAPGNMGLMDQRLAMKWIWTNARYFGGDPSRVTIFGESAGAVSVSLHMLLPESQKYFSRAIMNSGSALAYWASEDQARARHRAYILAVQLNCYVGHGNRKRIIGCMRHISPEKIQAKLYPIVAKINEERVPYYNRYQSRIGRRSNLTEPPLYFFYLPLRPVYGTDQNLNPLIVDSLAFEYQLRHRQKYGFNHWTSKDVLYAFDEHDGDNTFKCPSLPMPEMDAEAMHGYELDYTFGMPMGNRSHIVLEVKQGSSGYKVGENLRRRKCNFWNAQMRNIRNYMQQNVPCITEPKKSTQNISGGQGRPPALSSAILVWPGNSLCQPSSVCWVNAALRNSSESTYLFCSKFKLATMTAI
uniref:COesterase domain-containing protein n=1 Tax=Macrostomum lignano TaxID=282301 RepID=A0A1I8IS35_9PLAT